MSQDALRRLDETIRTAAQEALGVEIADLQRSVPPDPSLGDVSYAFCLPLARTLRKAPKAIAEGLAPVLSKLAEIAACQVAGAGYLNVRVERAWFLGAASAHPAAVPGKTVVEHSNINPNKAAHIGHIRNAVLGDTLVRCLTGLGHVVEIQNYIDDTGVQVADVAVGFQHLLGMDETAVHALAGHFATCQDSPAPSFAPAAADARSLWDGILSHAPRAFDVFCWHLYARVGPWYAEDEAREEVRRAALHAIEHHEGATARIAALISSTVQGRHLDTMGRLGIPYHVLPKESTVVQSGLWQETFQALQDKGAVRHVDDPADPHHGCWILPLQEVEGFSHLEEADKVIVRSNGTVTYVGKDLAYHRWKFGLSPIRLHARPYRTDAVSGTVWETTMAGGNDHAPDFGGGARVYNVIDVRQSYLQGIVKLGLALLGEAEASRHLVHFAYEMVALTPVAAEEMGVRLSDEDKARPWIEMSGRKGLGVMADALMDRLEERALQAVLERDPDGGSAARARARQIAVAALRYYMLRFGRNKVIAFDFREALAFEGDTGPYVLYSVVRARNILRKAGGVPADAADPAALAPHASHLGDADWALLQRLLATREVVSAAVEQLEFSLLARHAFELAQSFSRFYRDTPVAAETDPGRREALVRFTAVFADRMEQLLGLMGMAVPERM